jgi:hypothetical protein
MAFTEDYDPGFLNVPGFGQSATNPLAPVFYESLGIVSDLSVYNSIYAANTINANVAFVIGGTRLSQVGFGVSVPTNFQKDVNIKTSLDTKRLLVGGVEYKATRVKADNGTFTVLARVK